MSAHKAARAARRRRERGELRARLSAWLDLPLAVLGLVMLGLLVAQFALPLDPVWASRVANAQTTIWVIFILAFVIELALASSKLDYLRENWLTAVSVALPALRAVRLLRAAQALRELSLLRLITTLNRGTRALGHIFVRGQLGYVLVLTMLVTLSAAAGAYYLEHDEPNTMLRSPGDALWWAATLVTTINSPLETVTVEGRLLGLLLRIFAIGITGYLTATIAVYLLGVPRQPSRDHATVAELRRLRRAVRHLEAMVAQSRSGTARPPPGRRPAAGPRPGSRPVEPVLARGVASSASHRPHRRPG